MNIGGHEHDRLNSRKVYERRKRNPILLVVEVAFLLDLVGAQKEIVGAQEIHAKNLGKVKIKTPVKNYH
jgi:hypothetical protein